MIKKAVSFLALALALALPGRAVHVTIVESLTGNPWAVQDTVWRWVAQGMGFTATIVPQSTLDDAANLAGTDVLVVASGTISFGATNHLNTIRQFVLGGKPAYIQSEYQTTLQGSVTFDSLMQAVGAPFQWSGTVSGQLVPMQITGALSTTPNSVTTLGYFNYGLAGTGTGVTPFLSYQNDDFGFCYMDSTGAYGTVITVSDEDWAWNNASPALMQNILYKLATAVSGTWPSAGAPITWRLYPNPVSGRLTISAGRQGWETLEIFDVSGKSVYSSTGRRASAEVDVSRWHAGTYVVRAVSNGQAASGKVVVE